MTDTRLPADLQTLSRYPLTAADNVRFSDLDALGHVASTSVHVYFASARVLVLKRAIPDWPRGAQVPVLKSTLANHERELFYPASITLAAGIEKVGNTSFTVATAIFDAAGHCAGAALNTFVLLDAATRAPVAINDSIRAALGEVTLSPV